MRDEPRGAGERREILRVLRNAADLLRERERRNALLRGLDGALRAALVLGAGALFWSLCVWLFRAPRPDAAVVLVLVPVVLALGFCWTCIGRLARRTELGEVAERLDLALGSRNRIAAALEFSRDPRTPFEIAAVQDGLAVLRSAAGTVPWLEQVSFDGRRALRRAGTALVLFAAALLIQDRPFALFDAPSAGGAGGSEAPRVVSARVPIPVPRREAGGTGGARRSREETEAPVEKGGESRGGRGGASSGGEPERTRGQPRRGRSKGSRASRRASRGRGDPTEGGSSDRSPEEGTTRKKAAGGKPPKARVVGKRREQRRGLGATVGQSSSGGGAMKPVRSPWSQKDRSQDAPLPENPAEDDVDEEDEEREARGGAQPSLKDRKGAPSRDLSISGPGEGGEGRGGPTPPKKARGTAALVMGLPVPDFVRGLLNPGTTKVTHERVQPVPFEAPVHAVREDGASPGREPPLRGVWIDSSLRGVLRRFFNGLHASRTGGTQGNQEQ